MAYYRCTGEGGSTPIVQEPFIYNVDYNGDHGVGFNSGHKHTANTKVRMKAVFDTWLGYGQAFGARSENFRNNAFGFFPLFDGLQPCYYRTNQELRGTNYSDPVDTAQMWYGVPVILECEGQSASWYVDGFPSDVHTLNATSATVDAGIAPLGIFCGNNSTSPDGWTFYDPVKYMIFYWMEIYESDVLVHKFVPAYNNSQYCLYDEVDQTYIYECNGNYSRLRGSSDIPTS